MFPTEVSKLPNSFSPFRSAAKKKNAPDNFHLISRSFNESILRRLKRLSSPSISLSWLSLAVDFLSTTHAEVQGLISNLRSLGSSADEESISLYMDHSVKLLDICNSVSSAIEKLRQRRLVINSILRLLDVTAEDGEMPASQRLRKARDALADWENNSEESAKRRGFQVVDPEALIADLVTALKIPPRGKFPSAAKLVRRTFHAIGLATVFVAEVLASCVHGLTSVCEFRAPAEFLWADSFNDLQSAVFDKLKKQKRCVEVDDVAARVVRARDVIDVAVSGSSSNGKERLEIAVKELENATGTLSTGLDGLANGVNGLFNVVLSTRNSVMGAYNVGPA